MDKSPEHPQQSNENASARLDELYRYASARLLDEKDVEMTLSRLASTSKHNGKTDNQRDWLLEELRQQIRHHYQKKYSTRESRQKASDSVKSILAVPFVANVKPSAVDTEKLTSLSPRLFWRASRECLSLLQPVQAEIYILREMEDVSCDDIATMFGLAFEEVLELVYRGRMMFVQCLLNQLDN